MNTMSIQNILQLNTTCQEHWKIPFVMWPHCHYTLPWNIKVCFCKFCEIPYSFYVYFFHKKCIVFYIHYTVSLVPKFSLSPVTQTHPHLWKTYNVPQDILSRKFNHVCLLKAMWIKPNVLIFFFCTVYVMIF